MAEPNTTDRRGLRGYLLLAGLIAAAALIFNIDAIADLTRDHMDLVAMVHEAPRVRVGTPVWVEGVDVGRVSSVGLAPRSTGDADGGRRVAIGLRLEGRAGALVRGDSDVYTAARRFVGQPIVYVTAGSPDAPELSDGDTIRGRERPSPEDLLARTTELPAALDSLFRSIDRIRSLGDARTGEIGALVEQTVAVTRVARALSTDLDRGSLGRLLDDPVLSARIESLRRRVGQLETAVDETMARYTGPDALLADRLVQLSRRTDSLGSELAALQERLDTGAGLLARMNRDSALQVAVGGVQAQIDTLVAEAQSIALQMIVP